MKKILGLLLIMCLSLGMATTAFAAETSSNVLDQISVVGADVDVVYEDSEKALLELSVEPRGTNYGSAWLNTSSGGSFTLNSTNSGTLGFTFEVEASDGVSWAYLSVQKPNGGYYWNNVYVDTTAQVFKTAYFADSGTYTVHYNAYTSSGMRLMCWVYKN